MGSQHLSRLPFPRLCLYDRNDLCAPHLEQPAARTVRPRAPSASTHSALSSLPLSPGVLACLDYVYTLATSFITWFTFVAAETYLFIRLPSTHLAASAASTDLRLAAAAALVDAVLAAPVAMLVLLYGARRINRFERQIFLTTVALQVNTALASHPPPHPPTDPFPPPPPRSPPQDDGEQKRDLIAGKHTVLLALFSNPTVPPKLRQALRLEPLRFGQEMRFLLRSVPKVLLHRNAPAHLAYTPPTLPRWPRFWQVYLALVPAATLADAQRSLVEHSPRILMFSGHTLLGALAFEKVRARAFTTTADCPRTTLPPAVR